jgi:hypothetical protein
MKRSELEHVIRAAAAISNAYEIVVIGSQSILASYMEPPPLIAYSMEADVYPLDNPALAELIEGSIGEGSTFHDTFGYYAQGVGPETADLPAGWEQRLVRLQNANTDLKVGLCLEPHDLAAAKLSAGREKDWPFVRCLLDEGLVDPEELIRRLEALDVDEERIVNRIDWVKAQRPQERPPIG